MENNEENITWLDKAIEREALPKEAREENTEKFCKAEGIPKSTYYYTISKPDIKEKIINLALDNAKKYAPEVLDSLGRRGIKDNKAAELYLKFILRLSEKTDITSGDKPIAILNGLSSNNSDKQDSNPKEED
jgi:hypothetical protein